MKPWNRLNADASNSVLVAATKISAFWKDDPTSLLPPRAEIGLTAAPAAEEEEHDDALWMVS